MSAETMCKPSRPRRIVRNSRVDHPPVSGVPVAGANAGSMESICAAGQLSDPGSGWVRTHIDGQVDGLVAHGVADLLYNAYGSCRAGCYEHSRRHQGDGSHTYCVNFAGFDSLKARCIVVGVVRRSG